MTGKKGVTCHRWTEAERARLAEIANGRSHDEIREIMTAEFGDHFGGKRITAALKRYGIKTGRTGRFEKGNAGGFRDEEHRRAFIEAGRATRFKHGQVNGIAAKREQPIGSERISKDGYVEVKVDEGLQRKPNCNFRMKHHVVYEQAYGSIPRGCNVVFADGDNRNFDPGNLVAVPRNLWAVICHESMPYWDAESLRTCMAIVELKKAVGAAERHSRRCRKCGAVFAPRFTRQRTCDVCLGRKKEAR